MGDGVISNGFDVGAEVIVFTDGPVVGDMVLVVSSFFKSNVC